jgi:hypothetical protein
MGLFSFEGYGIIAGRITKNSSSSSSSSNKKRLTCSSPDHFTETKNIISESAS